MVWIIQEFMANIQKRGDSYKITVSTGYDVNGKKIRYYMTYNPPNGLSPSKLKKELNKLAVEFEEKCALGYIMDSNVKFIDFVEIWFKNYVGNKGLSPVTVSGYLNLSIRIVKELGHNKIGKITSKQLQDFYSGIKEGESHKGGKSTKVQKNF